MNDIFLFENKTFLSNFAKENVLYAFRSNPEKIENHLREDFTEFLNGLQKTL